MHPLAKTLSSSPDGDEGCRRREFGGHDQCYGVTVGSYGAESPNDDDEEQRADEEVGGDEKGGASVVDAAHIDQGQDGKDCEAEQEGVGLKAGDCGDEGSDACGDADRGGEDVVDHEGGCGEEAGALAEVLAGYGVAAAAVGVGVDGLEVGEEDDDQQPEDGEADRYDVGDAGDAERDKEGEGGFRTVGGGGQGVETEDGDGSDGADMLGSLFGGGERLAHEEVVQRHVASSNATGLKSAP